MVSVPVAPSTGSAEERIKLSPKFEMFVEFFHMAVYATPFSIAK